MSAVTGPSSLKRGANSDQPERCAFNPYESITATQTSVAAADDDGYLKVSTFSDYWHSTTHCETDKMIDNDDYDNSY